MIEKARELSSNHKAETKRPKIFLQYGCLSKFCWNRCNKNLRWSQAEKLRLDEAEVNNKPR